MLLRAAIVAQQPRHLAQLVQQHGLEAGAARLAADFDPLGQQPLPGLPLAAQLHVAPCLAQQRQPLVPGQRLQQGLLRGLGQVGQLAVQRGRVIAVGLHEVQPGGRVGCNLALEAGQVVAHRGL